MIHQFIDVYMRHVAKSERWWDMMDSALQCLASSTIIALGWWSISLANLMWTIYRAFKCLVYNHCKFNIVLFNPISSRLPHETAPIEGYWWGDASDAFWSDFENTIFIFRSFDDTLRSIPQDRAEGKSTLALVMALCRPRGENNSH